MLPFMKFFLEYLPQENEFHEMFNKNVQYHYETAS